MIELILAILAMLTAAGEEQATYAIPPAPEAAIQIETAPIEPLCDGATISIVWDQDGPSHAGQVDHNIALGSIRTDVVGTYLWVQFDDLDDGDSDNAQSVELTPGTTSVEICR